MASDENKAEAFRKNSEKASYISIVIVLTIDM